MLHVVEKDALQVLTNLICIFLIMKKTLLQIFIVSFVLLISALRCTESTKVKTISINPKEAEEIKLSEFIDTVKYIKLQTDSTCYSGRILDIIIRDKYIYLNDNSQNAIIIFNKKGKFVAKLNKHGKGPEEYSSIDGFVVDSNEEYIEILDNIKNKVFQYKNISFKLESKKDIKKISSNTIRKIGNYIYHSTHRIDNIVNDKTKEVNNADIIICKDDKIEKLLFPKKIVTNNSYYSVFSESFIINDKNKLFASLMFDNTFYEINKLEAKPILKVDFQGYGIDNDEIGLSSTEKQMKFITSSANKGKAILPFLTLNNKDILSFSYCLNVGESTNKDYGYPIEFRHYLYLKSTNKVFHAKKIVNDITEFPKDIWIRNFNKSDIVCEPWHKDYLVYVISPSIELSDEDEIDIKGLGKVNINDNPIIMLLKLKK